MIWIKGFFLILFTLLLVGTLGLIVLLKYPTEPPPLKPSKFNSPGLTWEELPEVNLTVLDTGYSISPEGFVAKGRPLTKMLKLTHSVVVVEHPKGTFIIDSGLGTGVDQGMAEAPWLSRLLNYTKETPLIQHPKIQDLLGKIDFFLISHVHWDHISGLLDFPSVPVHALEDEIDYFTQAPDPYRRGFFPQQVKGIKDRLVPIELKDEPYENFSRSLDLYGDGSVVIVSLEGHTPGSMGVFVNQTSARRFFFVGDAVYASDESGNPLGRPFLAELISDNDRQQARRTRQKLQELINHSNEITLVPIHDVGALGKVTAAQDASAKQM